MDGRVKRKTFADLMAEAALQGMPEDKTTADLLNVPLSRGAILPLTEYLDRAEFDLSSGLPGAFADAVTAPARAARGEISEDQMVPEAFNFAGNLTLGSLLAPRPGGSVGMGGRIHKSPLKGHDWTETAVSMKDVKPVHKYMEKGDWRSVNQTEPMEVSLPIRSMNASQPNVNPDFANYSGNNGLPFVIKKGGEYFVQDGHHRLVRQAAEGSQTAKVRLVDLDGDTQTDFPLLGDLLAANAKTGAAVPLATRALEGQQPQGIRAFHGSPHDFDRFSMEHIGTGEGAQAYGHGLYFAEAEDVARSYRDTLTKSGQDWGQRALDKAGGDVDAAISTIQSKIDKYRAGGADGYALAQEEVLRALNQYKETGSFSPGHMYEVNIKADPQDFLDWYAPTAGATMERVAPLGVKEGATGYEALQQVAAQLAKDGKLQTGKDLSVQVSESLREAGIPGIRYLDQMSRGAGEGSSNYVVFDDAIIDIVKKYGIAGLALLQAAGYGTNEGEETQ